jgi:hypothetical protein
MKIVLNDHCFMTNPMQRLTIDPISKQILVFPDPQDSTLVEVPDNGSNVSFMHPRSDASAFNPHFTQTLAVTILSRGSPSLPFSPAHCRVYTASPFIKHKPHNAKRRSF